MICSYLTVNMGQVKAGFVLVTLMEMIFQKRVRVLPPSPSRWLLPSHHPSEGECHAVRCEGVCDTADLGSPDTVTVAEPPPSASLCLMLNNDANGRFTPKQRACLRRGETGWTIAARYFTDNTEVRLHIETGNTRVNMAFSLLVSLSVSSHQLTSDSPDVWHLCLIGSAYFTS